MRRTRREDLDVSRAREIGEGTDDVAREAADVRVSMRAEEREVEHRDAAALGVPVPSEALHILIGSLDLIGEVLEEAVIDVGIGELLEERRREPDRHAIRDAGVTQIVEQAEEWQV